MNTARLNFTRLNTSVLNESLLNSSLMGGRGKGSSSRPSGLIAQYKPYLNSNDSPTRDVLKDYSGHGNDITLHNFAFAGMSGYGGYQQYSSLWSVNHADSNEIENDYTLKIIKQDGGSANFFSRTNRNPSINCKIKVSGLPLDNNYIRIQYYNNDLSSVNYFNLYNGINNVNLAPSSEEQDSIYIYCHVQTGIVKDQPLNVLIEFLPSYPGALVSDGVDDYGICENFPILTKEKGYTVCALRKWLNKEKDQVFLCKTNNPNHGAFMFECYERNEYKIYSYGQLTRVNEFPDLFSHQKTNQYNTTSISVGNYTDGSTLFLFRGIRDFPYYCEIALYALEIYDRDLSEEEIEQVKQRMIADYEKATGNILEPEENVWLWGDGDTVLWGDGTNVLTE